MSLARQIRILWAREMRASLRERSIVVNSILVPILLYPAILWAAFTGISFVQGQTEEMTARVAISVWPDGHPGLRRALERAEGLAVERRPLSSTEAAMRIEQGTLDAHLELRPATGAAAALAGNLEAAVTCNRSRERSAQAAERIQTALERYRQEWLEREGRARGLGPAELQVFALERRELASSRDVGAFLLGLILPVFFVVMVAVGCFYPAVDATAGERERNTWETLMSTAASRPAIVIAKYLVVTTFGMTAGLLNLAAMMLTIKPVLRPLLQRAGAELHFSLPWTALPVMALGSLLLAAFVAAGMMIFSAFARTFKEGQSMITPFYMVVLVPVMFLQAPGLELSLPLAVAPIVNVTLMVREAIGGTFRPLPMLVTVASSAAVIAGCLWLAAVILRREDVVIGSFSGGLKAFVRQIRWPGRGAGGEVGR